jgi:hypothetical protein
LAGSENSYAAIVATTDADCVAHDEVAIHEFGHLFGAGHVDNPSGYLFFDSHAYHFVSAIPPIVFNIRSIMSTPIPGSFNTMVFSQTTGQDNMRTLNTTAQSVSNYRAPPPPSCSIAVPDEFFGLLTGVCNPSPWTSHSLSWDDGCPEESTSYVVWGEQPIGYGYFPRWTTVLQSTPIYVAGANANIKVQACNSSECSPVSSETYHASSNCGSGF